MIPASVLETTRRYCDDTILLKIVIHPRSVAELAWIGESLKKNSNRLVVFPDGSPIMHPASERPSPKIDVLRAKTDVPVAVVDHW
ncbi:MAG: hypothetical protein FWF12_00135 [Betaproteobacteria bacterium]|nr:hypothetical protein [Betaproteobacteria bacterium]